jgi:hypothetical protein
VILKNYNGDNYYELQRLSEKVLEDEKINLVQIEQKNSEILENEIRVMQEIKDYEAKLANLGIKEKESKKRNDEINTLNKYGSLDYLGKHTIDTVLDMEFNRCKKQ